MANNTLDELFISIIKENPEIKASLENKIKAAIEQTDFTNVVADRIERMVEDMEFDNLYDSLQDMICKNAIAQVKTVFTKKKEKK